SVPHQGTDASSQPADSKSVALRKELLHGVERLAPGRESRDPGGDTYVHTTTCPRSHRSNRCGSETCAWQKGYLRRAANVAHVAKHRVARRDHRHSLADRHLHQLPES